MANEPKTDLGQPTSTPSAVIPQSPCSATPVGSPAGVPQDGETPDLDMGIQRITEGYDERNLQIIPPDIKRKG